MNDNFYKDNAVRILDVICFKSFHLNQDEYEAAVILLAFNLKEFAQKKEK
jgi:hypothetical protein